MRNVIISFFFSLIVITLGAQQVYIQPPIARIDGCTSISDLYSVTFNNFQSSQVQCAMTIDVTYSGSSLENGLKAQGSLTGSPIFNLPIGTTRITTSNAGEYFPTRNLMFFDKTLENLNSESACLPPGAYEVCIALFGLTTSGAIDPQNKISQTCYTITKTNTNNIFLIAPQHGTTVNLNLPIFTWSPVANFSPKSNYAIEFVEVLDGQTPFEAFRSNPIFYRNTDLKTNTFQYPINARSFDQCKTYAWKVGYYQDAGFNNSGFSKDLKYEVQSELWQFQSMCQNNTNAKTTRSLTAPALITPSQGQMLSRDMSKILFSWTEITPAQDYPITYMLRVVERPIDNSPFYYFENGSPILSQPIVDNNYFMWHDIINYLDKDKEYVWGIIPYNAAQEQLIEDIYIAKQTFKFKDIIDPGTNKRNNCNLDLDFSLVEETPNFYEQTSSFLDIKGNFSNVLPYEFYLKLNNIADLDPSGELINTEVELEVIESNIPVLTGRLKSNFEVYGISPQWNKDFPETQKDKVYFKVKACVNPRWVLNQGTPNEVILCSEKKCVDIIYGTPSEPNKPQLTKFEAMQGFPLLEPDKSLLIKFEIEDNALEFPDYSMEYGEMVFEATELPIILDVIERDDNTHTYKLLPKDIATLEPIDITDAELDISVFNMKASFNYEILDRDNPGGLPVMQIDTSIILPFIPITPPCDLQITTFNTKTNTFPFIPGNMENSEGVEIQDAFLLDFSIDTREQPNRPDLYQRNHRVNFTINSSSIPITIDTITKSGRVQKYAIVPQWGNIPASDRNINAISFDIDACLRIDFNDVNDNTNCTQVRCIDIIHEGEQLSPCPITIPKFEVKSVEYIPGSMNSIDHPDTEVSEFYYYQFDFGLDNVQLPDGYQMETHVMFSNLNSNIPINYYNLGQDYAWAITPMYDMLDYDMDEQEVFFSVDACVTSEIYDESGLLQCLDSECLTLNNMKNQGINETGVEDPCDIETLIFEVSEGYPIVSSEHSSIVDLDGDALSGDYFIYDFDIELGSDQNSVVEIIKTELETVSSNIPLYFSKTQDDKYAIVPYWNLSDEFGVSDQEDVWFDVIACLEYSVLSAYGTDTLCYVEKDTCINLVQLSESFGEDNNPSLSSETDCQFQVDFTYETIGDNVILKPTALPFDPNIDYAVSWKFEDGTQLQVDNPFNGIPISSEGDQNEDNEAKYTVGFEDVAGQYLTLEVSIEGDPCVSTVTKKIRNIPNCDATQCDFAETSNTSTLTTNDQIELCGDMFIEITSLSNTSANSLSGYGTVYIPWLLTNVEVGFNEIKVNNSLQLIYGEVTAVYDENIAGVNMNGLANSLSQSINREQIININKYLTENAADKIVKLKEDIENIDLRNTMKLPLGFNNMPVGDNSKALTVAISGLKFEPNQNFMKATAAIEFFDSGQDGNTDFYLAFDSDNFFFNSSKPIFNLGNSLDFKFKLTEDVSLKYYNSESLEIIFKAPDNNGNGGTGIEFTSECNEPYDWCINIEAEVDIPESWLKSPDDAGLEKVKASFESQICNFSDFIIEGNLSPAIIPGTNGTELEVANVTWDHSNLADPVGLEFPDGYNNPPIENEFQGLFIEEVLVKLPKQLKTFDSDDRITASLNNLIIEKGNGFSVDAEILPNLSIPEMNVADLGASLDTFKLSIIQNVFEEAYISGFITLPVADYDENNADTYNNKVVYKVLLGDVNPDDSNNELQFILSLNNTIKADLLAGANLQLFRTSNMNILLDDNNVSFNLELNGLLDFPDGNVYDPESDKNWGFSLDAGFEKLGLSYIKQFGEESGSLVFNKGNWTFDGIPNFASNYLSNTSSNNQDQSNVDTSSFEDSEEEGNGIEGFKFTIENFGVATGTPSGNELLVGGIGFDAVVNIGDKISGSVGIKILGVLKKESNQRIRTAFKGLQLSNIGVKANLSALSIEGNIEFFNDQISGKGIKGDISAQFKLCKIAVNASALFGNTLSIDPINGYKYWKVEAAARFSPGIPLFPGFEINGFGAGAYKNMLATGLNNVSVPANANTVFPGVSFTPQKAGWGFGINMDAATTPKEEGANATLGFTAAFSSSGGIQNLGINGQLYSGCTIQERKSNPSTDKAILAGNMSGNYDFPNRVFHLNSQLDLRAGGILTGQSIITIHSDGNTGKYYFHAGKPDQPNYINVNLLGASFTSQNYFMFGNTNIYGPSQPLIIPPDFMDLGNQNAQAVADFAEFMTNQYASAGITTNYFMPETVDGLVRVGGPGAVFTSPPNYLTGSNISLGKGFAFGVGLNVKANGNCLFGYGTYNVTAGAEFNLSMLNYGQNATCLNYGPPIGINGYYLNTSLAAYLYASAGANDRTFLELGAAVQLTAKLPNPWGIKGSFSGKIKFGLISFNKTIDIEAGELNCNPAPPNLDQTFDQEYAQESFDDAIVRKVFLTDGQEFNPNDQIKLELNYPLYEQIAVPERQTDGSIKTRVFEPIVKVELWIKTFRSDGQQMDWGWQPIQGFGIPFLGGVLTAQGLTPRQNSFGQYEWFDYFKENGSPPRKTLLYDTTYKVVIIEDLFEILEDGSRISVRDRNGNLVAQKSTSYIINSTEIPSVTRVPIINTSVNLPTSYPDEIEPSVLDNENSSVNNDISKSPNLVIRLNKIINQVRNEKK